MRISRDIVALIVSLVLFGLVPIYGEPFGGCMESGYRTWEIGCSAWPEFLRGFVFMAALVVIASHKKVFVMLGIVTVLLVVMVGGVGLISTGEEAAYFQANYLAIAQHASNPLLIGVFAALFLYVAISKTLLHGANNVQGA